MFSYLYHLIDTDDTVSYENNNRPNITPYPTNTDRPSSRAYVDDATLDTLAQMGVIGSIPDYLAQVGEEQHRLGLPLYTGDASDLNPYELSTTDSNKQDIMFDLDTVNLSDARENHRQLGCYQRLKDLYRTILGASDFTQNDLFDSDFK